MSTENIGGQDGEEEKIAESSEQTTDNITETTDNEMVQSTNNDIEAKSSDAENVPADSVPDRSDAVVAVASTEHIEKAEAAVDNVEVIDMSEEMKDAANGEDLGIGAAEGEENEDQFVVHVDESDTNLDYDLGDKPEERDAPTPTKDESMDVDAADIIQSGDGAAASETGGEKTAPATDAATTDQTTKRFVVSNLCFLLTRKLKIN